MGSLSLLQGRESYPGLKPEIKPRSPALQADSLPAEPAGKPKNTGVGSASLLQGIFPTQEIELESPALQADSLLTELPGTLTYVWAHVCVYACIVRVCMCLYMCMNMYWHTQMSRAWYKHDRADGSRPWPAQLGECPRSGGKALFLTFSLLRGPISASPHEPPTDDQPYCVCIVANYCQ